MEVNEKVIKESKNLIIEAVPILEKSKTGWIKLLIIFLIVASSITGVGIGLKLDPNKVFQEILKLVSTAEFDAVCHKKGDTVICD